MNARELFAMLMEYPQPTRTEVLEALDTLTRNYDQEYTEALLTDFEELLNDWKYSKVVTRLKSEYNEKVLEPYQAALHIAEYAMAMGSSEPIEWPEEPAPFTPPPPFPGCYDDSLIFIAPMYEYAVEVLRSHRKDNQEAHNSNVPDIPPELTTPQASEIFKRAKDEGLIDDGYNWLKGKQFLACFARRMSLALNLSKRINPDGTPRISWKPFEVLFGYQPGKLRANYNDVKGKYGESQEVERTLNRIFQ